MFESCFQDASNAMWTIAVRFLEVEGESITREKKQPSLVSQDKK